jgi:SAM-dependent methyltransferase
MALDAPGRRVIGADIDGRKLSFARRAAEGLPVEIHHGDLFEVLARAGEAPSAIAIIDVLYLIPPKCQEGLLSTAFSALNAGGILVIKEMDRRPAWKWWWNRFQEFLACRILRITRHQSGVVGLRPAEDWVQVLRSAGFIDVAARPIHRGFPHPHLLVSARKPTGGGAP